MTKITTDFVGSETIAVTKQRLTDILAYWGASTAAYTTWGQARTALNALLTSTTAGTIGSTELAGSFLPKINFLNDPDEMIADALFGAGEQGVWLDPSDVANVAWRRNLLTYSEDFTNAVWSKSLVTVTANAILAPDGISTTDTIIPSTATNFHYLNYVATVVSTTSYVVSFYAKNGGYGFIRYYDGTSNAVYTLSGAGAITDNSGGASTITSVGDGWYRCTKTIVTASTTRNISIYPQNVAGMVSYAGDGTSGVYLWGAQLELGTVATDYQRITDLNTEVIERFPNATMYQDAAGTTPVTAPGQPVGLRLDKSKGLVLGSEIVVNGTFNTDLSGWTASGATPPTWTTNGVLIQNTSDLRQSFTTVIGRTYLLTSAPSVNPATTAFLLVGTTNGGNDVLNSYYPATGQAIFTATSSTSFLRIVGGTFCYFTIDNISVKELAGNHAVQSTLGSRPMYGIEPKGGRRNLLTWSEDYSNAAWVKTEITTSANVAVAPDGTMTADKFIPSTNAAEHRLQQSITAAAEVCTGTVYVKSDGSNVNKVSLYNGGGGCLAFFNISTLTASGEANVTSTSITDVGSGWYRLQATWPATQPTSRLWVYASSGTLGISPVAGNGTDGIFIWGAQLELGSTATNYQRVTTDFDVTEAGVNTCHYCQYDGSDDGMVTNSIDFTATDKMSVFAGVRKASDAAAGFFAELSTNAATNNGAFYLSAPNSGGLPEYVFLSRGTALTFVTPTGYSAPINNVLTALADISGDRLTGRVNGSQIAQSTADQGTGNFGNYPLYLGRRGGTTNPFNGRDYGILITGKLANATAIATTEMWLANKTAGVNL